MLEHHQWLIYYEIGSPNHQHPKFILFSFFKSFGILFSTQCFGDAGMQWVAMHVWNECITQCQVHKLAFYESYFTQNVDTVFNSSQFFLSTFSFFFLLRQRTEVENAIGTKFVCCARTWFSCERSSISKSLLAKGNFAGGSSFSIFYSKERIVEKNRKCFYSNGLSCIHVSMIWSKNLREFCEHNWPLALCVCVCVCSIYTRMYTILNWIKFNANVTSDQWHPL